MTTNYIGIVHSSSVRMSQLSRSIMHLHPESPSRAACIKEYIDLLTSMKVARDHITDVENRKLANFLIRTVCKPVNNDGSPVIS
jgi:hypothetical protein